MTVTDVRRDPAARTLTLTAEYASSPEQVWQLWADPRLLERWWGPPTYPATVVDHDLTPGGRVTYYMTGPDGDQHHGWWLVNRVQPPSALEFDDGFADEHGSPSAELPVSRVSVDISPEAEGARMVITHAFPSDEAMEQLLGMGLEEGSRLAVSQIDALLAAPATA